MSHEHEQIDYTEQCHQSLPGTTDEKQSQCFQKWRESRGDTPLESRTASRFGNGFTQVRDVPVFAEHTTRDRNGDTVVYDRNALSAIAQRCNDRIDDTGDYAPITDGHTPDKDQLSMGASMPEVLGYSGPYRLGKIGNKNPRWAIFADEWWHNEDVTKLRKLRRRSPEVWLEDRMEDRFFDPIAALGAETPRLDMGMTRYARIGGRLVEKYTAASPSAFNVSPIEEVDVENKDDYAMNPWIAAGLGAVVGRELKQCPPCPGQGNWRTAYAAGEEVAEGSAVGVMNAVDWVRKNLPDKHPSDKGLSRLLRAQGVPEAMIPQSLAEARAELSEDADKYGPYMGRGTTKSPYRPRKGGLTLSELGSGVAKRTVKPAWSAIKSGAKKAATKAAGKAASGMKKLMTPVPRTGGMGAMASRSKNTRMSRSRHYDDIAAALMEANLTGRRRR